jgi:hypothetical protein
LSGSGADLCDPGTVKKIGSFLLLDASASLLPFLFMIFCAFDAFDTSGTGLAQQTSAQEIIQPDTLLL